MSNPSRIYLAHCPLCEQGLIRAAACATCEKLVAICDECEAVWSNPRHIKNAAKPDGQHPECPHCQSNTPAWQFSSKADLEAAGLTDLIEGESV